MGRPLPHRALLTVIVGLLLFGCAAKPPEKPIVLRRTSLERRIPRAAVPRRPHMTIPAATPTAPKVESGSPAPAEAPPLTADQKEELFQQFDSFLAKPAQP